MSTPVPGTSEFTFTLRCVTCAPSLHLVSPKRHSLSCLLPSYYVNGRDASLDDFLDPVVLDTLTVKTNKVLQVIMYSRVFHLWEVQVLKWICVFPPCPGSQSGFSREEGLAGRDEFSLRRRSCRTVGHIRSRIHVSF